MTSFQPEEYLVKTRGVAECFLVLFRFKWRNSCFYYSTETRKLFFIFFCKVTRIFSSSRDVIHVSTLKYKMKMTLSVSLFPKRKWGCSNQSECKTRVILQNVYRNLDTHKKIFLRTHYACKCTPPTLRLVPSHHTSCGRRGNDHRLTFSL